jgi:hypothetical protein
LWFFQLNLEKIKKFLDLLKRELRSLTLIVVAAEKNFSNFIKFQSLVTDFTHLQTFQYYIRTDYQPDPLFLHVKQLPGSSYSIFTIPLPQEFDTNRAKLVRTLSREPVLQELFSCTTIEIYHSVLPPSLPIEFEL